MRTKSLFSYLSMILLCMGIFINSCTKEELVSVEVDNSDLVLKSSHLDGTCQLIAGQNMLAGTVSYEIDGDEIEVTVETQGMWYLAEVHIYAGPKADIPHNKSAIKVGQFPVSDEDLECASSATYTLPYSAVWPDPILAVHAVVTNCDEIEETEETAWGRCCPVFAVKARLNDGLTDWGLSDGITLYSSGWCGELGFNPYMDGFYDLKLMYSGGTVVGTIEVDGNTVTVTPASGTTLCESYVYVGSIDDMPMANGCPDYFQWNTVTGACEEAANVHTVAPPDCESESFADAFGISRWGWVIGL